MSSGPATAPPGRAAAEAPYLLVFDGSSSRVFELPAEGEILIGSGARADLRLADAALPPELARLTITSADVRIRPLGGAGITVNGEALLDSRSLVTGDTIAVAGHSLVFQRSARRRSMCAIVDLAQFRERADEEFERTARFGRPWTVAAIELGPAHAHRPTVIGALASNLRRIDVAAWDGEERILVLLAEAAADAAMPVLTRLLQMCASVMPAAKAGFAACPVDGYDVDALLASARAAVVAAGAGQIVPAKAASTTLRVGERTVLVADPAMARIFSLVEKLAATDLSVLVYGETGTGKDLVASALHFWSARRDRPLVTFNCAAIPEHLVESELFGHEKGAFSGAVSSKTGLLATGDGGTVFLDEIGELPADAQAKLLRVLETKRIRPVGEVREREVDIRIVAATNRNLETEVQAGRFRKDLFFRMKGAAVWLPPLRDRARELPMMARAFLTEACAQHGRPEMGISDEAMRALETYSWPGNVRELQSLMSYVATVTHEPILQPRHLADWLGGLPAAPVVPTAPAAREEAPVPPPPPPPAMKRFRTLEEEIEELERTRIADALAATGGNQTRAAALLGMPRRTFISKLKAYNLAGGANSGEGGDAS